MVCGKSVCRPARNAAYALLVCQHMRCAPARRRYRGLSDTDRTGRTFGEVVDRGHSRCLGVQLGDEHRRQLGNAVVKRDFLCQELLHGPHPQQVGCTHVFKGHRVRIGRRHGGVRAMSTISGIDEGKPVGKPICSSLASVSNHIHRNARGGVSNAHPRHSRALPRRQGEARHSRRGE
jgi:hypothetical protein